MKNRGQLEGIPTADRPDRAAGFTPSSFVSPRSDPSGMSARRGRVLPSMLLKANPKLSRQLALEGPQLLWRDKAGGGREGLLITCAVCPDLWCTSRHVLLSARWVEDRLISAKLLRTKLVMKSRPGTGETTRPGFYASVDVDDGAVELRDKVADPAALAWFKAELDAELRAVLLARFEGERRLICERTAEGPTRAVPPAPCISTSQSPDEIPKSNSVAALSAPAPASPRAAPRHVLRPRAPRLPGCLLPVEGPRAGGRAGHCGASDRARARERDSLTAARPPLGAAGVASIVAQVERLRRPLDAVADDGDGLVLGKARRLRSRYGCRRPASLSRRPGSAITAPQARRCAITGGSRRRRYRMKRPRAGSLFLLLTPDELLARLATLVPPPRVRSLRYHGLFAPHAKARD